MDILLHPLPHSYWIATCHFQRPGPLAPLCCCEEFERKFKEQNVPRAPQNDGDLSLGSKPRGLLESRYRRHRYRRHCFLVITRILLQSSQVSSLPLKLLVTGDPIQYHRDCIDLTCALLPVFRLL